MKSLMEDDMLKIIKDKITGKKYIRSRRMICTNADSDGIYMRSYIGVELFKLTIYVMDESEFESRFDIVKIINFKTKKIEDVE